jgi:hypothetical protein
VTATAAPVAMMPAMRRMTPRVLGARAASNGIAQAAVRGNVINPN